MSDTIEILGEILFDMRIQRDQFERRDNIRASIVWTKAIDIVKHTLLKAAETNDVTKFDLLVECRVARIKATLQKKGEEYATDDDRFHNFKAAGRKRNQTPEQALVGMMAKHEVSVDDLVEWAEISPERITTKLINEKLGDNINYLILLEGLLKERIGAF